MYTDQSTDVGVACVLSWQTFYYLQLLYFDTAFNITTSMLFWRAQFLIVHNLY